jgi:hypothetical protein
MESLHEEINQEEINELSQMHKWIADPIQQASNTILDSVFFKWINTISDPKEFGQAAKQLYFHSVTFPKCMSLMCAFTPLTDSKMLPFYTGHAFTEADHHLILMEWMIKHGILKNEKEIHQVLPSIETNACVNLGYQIAVEQDKEKWIVTINSGIELCSHLFFKVIAKKMHEIGAGHHYFDIHVEADEYHSIMGFKHINSYDPKSFRGSQLIAAALEGISLWGSMINSWIGVDYRPKFNNDGMVKSNLSYPYLQKAS